MLCEQWQMYRTLSNWLDEDPDRLYFVTENGYQQETPQVRLREKGFALSEVALDEVRPNASRPGRPGKHGGVAKKQMPAIAEFAKKKYEE